QVIYHSHTHSPAYPSATDVRLATWPEASYVLVSLEKRDAPDVRSYRIVDGEVTEETVVIV
ncbi:MAG: Mov34/MPN/PAD-1 family protein, partial [Chloroflexi bacterium]|nr:Mov34/MPN/PAD-1 family protein [Chloroflexota bacterium]